MKPSSLLGLLCLLLAFCACQKEKAVSASGKTTFTLDNTAYTSNDSRGVVTNDSSGIGKKVLTITTFTGNITKMLSIAVIFPDTLAVGEYTGDNSMVMWADQMSDTIPAYVSTKATVKITSINSKYAEGTFAGILNNGETEKPLTDGIFKVNIN